MAKDYKNIKEQSNLIRTPSLLNSWTRLAVGTTLYALETLVDKTRYWEKQSTQHGIEGQNKTIVIDGSNVDAENKRPPMIIKDDTSSLEYSPMMHATIGFLFDAQRKIRKGQGTFHRIERLVDQVADPVFSLMRKNILLKPIYRQFDAFVMKGSEEIDRWSSIGRIEERKSRDLVKTATVVTLDASIDYLSTNPDVQELVQTQSSSLINELIEEVRERAVSINTVLEGWIRKMLGLIPRDDLPGPPIEIRRHASLFHMQDKRQI